ncbi:MAG TPA: pirin family protein [Burkholderiales bacterium]|nr:pirin family protein [Burkholderiales bacterium]
MMEVRKAQDRGYADHGWLKSYHTFSFADYFDPEQVEFGALRVINEDRVAAGKGFGTHAHRDMEIISYVLEGRLEHKDSIGTGSVIEPGDVQRMSAGSGVRHSEFNPSPDEPVHFLQIWIQPSERGIPPSYEQKRFDAGAKRGRLRLIAAPDAREGSVTLHQDALVYAGLFDGDETAVHAVGAGRRAYVHVARGKIKVNGEALAAGDGAKLTGVTEVKVDKGEGAEVILFDLP